MAHICSGVDNRLSRNTIRKYLRLGGVEPKFKVPDRPSKLDPFADRLSLNRTSGHNSWRCDNDVM